MSASGYTGNPPGSGGGGGSGAVDSVNGRTGAVVLSKTDVGLANVTNTSDANKPVSTAQQTALDLKANLAGPTFTGTVAGITKTMVGLGSVDNTADTAKPVSTAQQTALDLKAPLASPTFTGTPAAPTAAPGTNTTQLASTAYVTAAVAAGGGGGGSSIVVKRAQVTATGNISPQSSPGVWAQFTGAPTIAIPAVVGNYVEFEILGMLWAPVSAFIDLAVIVGGSLARFMATDTSSGGAEGGPAFYPQPSTFRHYGPVFDFVVAAGDLSGGNVTVGFATKGNGTGTLYASTDYPLRWRAVNYGSVSVT